MQMKNPEHDPINDIQEYSFVVPVYDELGDEIDQFRAVVKVEFGVDRWGWDVVTIWMPDIEDPYIEEDLRNLIHDHFYGYEIIWA
jgi:hypothetical protein